VREGKTAGITYLVCAGITIFFSTSSVLDPREISQYSQPSHPMLLQYGAGGAGLLIGAILFMVGLYCLRHESAPHPPGSLIWDHELAAFGPILGAPCLLFGIVCVTQILPYTAERGFVPGQVGSAVFLFIMMTGAAWVFMHHRRMAVIDPEARTVELTWGKVLVAKRSRHAFSDFNAVAIEKVSRKRGYVYRVVAEPGRKLIAFWFNEQSAAQFTDELARMTGWTKSGLKEI
jgi:hypothetical protein